MASMPMNDKHLIESVMLICFNSAKLLLFGVIVVHFSNDHIVSSLICGCQKSNLYVIPCPFFEISNSELRLR